MKDLRNLKDMTIHDVQPIIDKGGRSTCVRVAFRVAGNRTLTACDAPGLDVLELCIAFNITELSEAPELFVRMRRLLGGQGGSPSAGRAGRLAKHPQLAARHVVEQLAATDPVDGRMRAHAVLFLGAAR